MFNVAYVPIGVGTFHLESAQGEFDRSIALLGELTDNLSFPKQMLLTLDLLREYLDTLNPDLIILQNVTFANAAYTYEVVKRFECPVLLWTLREPAIDGTRLRLNSLTGAFSAGNTLKQFGTGSFEYVYGGPTEEKVISKISKTISAAKLKYDLAGLNLLAIGHTPEGFGFGRALDVEMLKKFKVTLKSIEARELIDRAKTFSDDEVREYIEDAKTRIVGLESTPEKNLLDFARLYKSYKEYVSANNIGALASRCWPDFFTAFGTPVCAVLAILNDLGVVSACEADTFGALSMYMAAELSKRPVFFGDPVSLDEKENTITFWHCGMAACSLARKDTGAQASVHCNRKIGPTLDFGCEKSEHATVFRIHKDENGKFKFIVFTGEVLDKPKQFNGTSVVVKTEENAEKLIYDNILDGAEPHFVVAFEDIREELLILERLLN